jgi:CHASE1-domain containing sensor protein
MDQSNPQKALRQNIEEPTQNTALNEVPYPFTNRETHYDELLFITPPNNRGE